MGKTLSPMLHELMRPCKHFHHFSTIMSTNSSTSNAVLIGACVLGGAAVVGLGYYLLRKPVRFIYIPQNRVYALVA